MKQRSSRQRASRKGGRGDQSATYLDTYAPSAESLPMVVRSLERQTRIVRKMLAHSGTISTSAGGYVIEQAVAGSNSVTACGTWSSMSANFLEYRVVGIELAFFPVLNATTSFTTPPPCMLALCSYSSGLAPTTYDQVAQGPQAKLVNALRPFRFDATAKGLPDAMLFCATNATISSTSTFGVVIASDSIAPAGPVSQVVLRWTVKYLVDFRSLD